jgi:hypothetical protein
MVQSQPGHIVLQDLSQKPFTKIGLVEWLKVKARVQAPVPHTKKETYIDTALSPKAHSLY